MQRPKLITNMLQIQNMQKALLRESIFDVHNTEDTSESESSTIHSGHFMVSRVHEDKDEDDDDEVTNFSDDSKDFSVTFSSGYDFLQANKATSQTYNFGPKSTQTLSIDASLTKLFECMTLAYSGKITSPKWKPFRGMHLTVKDKVRLNNIIWREWHMQYIFMRRSVVCQFATPLSDYIHTKPEAVVLEGKYWKRRLDTVTKEYKTWRRYYRDRILPTLPETPSIFSSFTEQLSEGELLERVKDVNVMPRNIQQSSTDLSLLNADLMDMDFTDNLFSSLNQPFAFPNPREISQLSCADLIQPGLVQLQPNLEDFMDIDTMQEFLAVSKQSNTTLTPPSTVLSDLGSVYMTPSQSQPQIQFQNAVLGLLDPAIFNSGGTLSNTAGISMLTALAALTSTNNNTAAPTTTNNHNIPVAAAAAAAVAAAPIATATTAGRSNSLFSPETQMIIDDALSTSNKQVFRTSSLDAGSFQAGMSTYGTGLPVKEASQSSPALPTLQRTPELQQPQQHQQQQQPTVNTAGLGLTQTQSPPQAQQPLSQPPSQSQRPRSQSHLQSGVTDLSLLGVVQGTSSPAGTAHSPRQAKAAKGPISAKVSSRTVSPSHTVTSGRVASSHHQGSSGKKDGFIVPQGKPAAASRKPRTIAPAPNPPRSATSSTSSASMPTTYLAQLLLKGTYHGALIKKEPGNSNVVSVPTSNYTPILPAVPASSPQRAAPTQPILVPQTAAATFAPTTITSTSVKLPSDITMEINKVTGVDFPTRVLLQAASSALGTTSSSLKDALRLNPACTSTASTAAATEMNTTPAASPKAQSPMSMAFSPSPVQASATPPPSQSSPLAAVFSEALSPIPGSPSTASMSSFPSSPPSPLFNKDEGLGAGIRMGVHTEQRRVAHLSAEQKRRCNLKSGFDLLHTLVPALAQNPKVSKATMLQKTAEHCRKMKAERIQMQHEAAILKQEIESLNNAISVVQSQLPETGVPVTRQRVDQMKEMFSEYVRSRTLQNWKFWIFSIIIRPLFDSYNNMVSTSNVEELCRTTAAWLDQHCSLVSLRPTVLNALRHLSMSTSILTEPQRVQEQATQAVIKGTNGKGGHS